MRLRFFEGTLAACALAGLLAAPATAAEHRVGAGQTFGTLTAAITAASAGDTILIMDSAEYVENLQITKQLQIAAAPGANPTFKAATNSRGIEFKADSAGSQFGSNSGGRITIDAAYLSTRHIYFEQTGATTVTMENVKVQGAKTNGVFYGIWFQPAYATGAHGPVVLRNCEIDMNGIDPSDTPAVPTAYIQLLRYDNLGGGVLTFDRCLLKNARTTIVEGRTTVNSFGTINFINCEVDHTLSNPNVSRFGAAITTAVPTGKSLILNIEGSLFRTNNPSSSYGFINVTGPNTVANVTNSAFIGTHPAVRLPSSATGTNINFTKSDILITTNSFINALSTNTLTLALNQTNVFAPMGTTYTLPVGNATYTMNNVNDYSTVNAYAPNWTVTGSVQPGQDPGYVDAINKNFVVTNTFIAERGIGADRNFANIVPVELSAFGLQ